MKKRKGEKKPIANPKREGLGPGEDPGTLQKC